MRLAVHDVEEWPLIDEYGMDISPSSYTQIAITEVSNEILSNAVFVSLSYSMSCECYKAFNTKLFLDKT